MNKTNNPTRRQRIRNFSNTLTAISNRSCIVFINNFYFLYFSLKPSMLFSSASYQNTKYFSLHINIYHTAKLHVSSRPDQKKFVMLYCSFFFFFFFLWKTMFRKGSVMLFILNMRTRRRRKKEGSLIIQEQLKEHNTKRENNILWS